ncbi:MAG: glycosyltransferase family 4 protein [Candidatus Thorarchaeota archaeon]|nr:glycosyltransferase family 4 protein [Candidatus Thorarchaeota archaeon]
MKIVHVCPCLGEQLGGSERFVAHISKQQVLEHDVTVLTTTRFPSKVGDYFVDGVKINRTYAPVTVWNIDPLCFIAPKISKLDADIIHVHSYLYTLSAQAIFAKRLSKKKALLQLHGGLGPVPYRTSITRRMVKRVYDQSIGTFIFKNSDIIASVSYRDLEYVANHHCINPEKLHYVPNFVDIEQFRFKKNDLKKGKPVLLYVGDLEHWKGLNLIYDWIVNKNRESKNQFTFRFVGQGSLYSKFAQLKDKIDRQENGITIEMYGQREHCEIPSIMAESDALVLPSYWEGLPTVILEAMASGLPVIATPVGDIPRILRNGNNGMLIRMNIDSIDSALTRILDYDPDVQTKAKRARETVETRYTLKSVNNQLDFLYSEMNASS